MKQLKRTIAQTGFLFCETQRFTQWWMWALLLALLGLPLFGIYVQFFEGQPWGNRPMSDAGLLVFAILMLGFVYFFRWMKLTTTCNQEGIVIHFRPFVRRRISWEEIEIARIVDYGFVGYGIRLGSPYGTIYNTSGRTGLALELRSGKKLVIGTLRADELHEVVNKEMLRSRKQ